MPSFIAGIQSIPCDAPEVWASMVECNALFAMNHRAGRIRGLVVDRTGIDRWVSSLASAEAPERSHAS